MSNLPHEENILQDAVERSFRDPAYFLRFFLQHWFPSRIPAFHLGIIAIRTRKVEFLDEYEYAHDFLLNHMFYEPDPAEPDASPIAVFVRLPDGSIGMREPRENTSLIIPRGFSKTTLNKGLDVYELLVVPGTFGVYISESATHAEAQLLDVRTQLETNHLLRKAYGNQVPTRAEPQVWSADEIQLLNGCILVARGRGAQVRGLTRDGRRPNLITLDDIEDEDSVATVTQRQKTKNWFYGSVKPAGQLMEGALNEEWAQTPLRIISLGTLLGAECLVADIIRDETFSTIRLGAKIQPGLMLWEYKMTEPTYDRMRAQYQRQGQLSHFTKEYDSVIRVSEEALFPELYIYMPVSRNELVQVAQVLDPAISEAEGADEAAIIVAARHSSGALWFLDEWGGTGKSPTEKIQAFFEMQERWRVDINGIEAIAYQASLLHLAREEMARRKHYFQLVPVRHGSKQSKEARIVGTLSPRYQNHAIRHFRPLQKLESNLTDWPNGRKDFADAGAMALNLLGETAGLVMEGALEDQPAVEHAPIPAPIPTVGNFIMRSSSGRPSPGRNPRYGG